MMPAALLLPLPPPTTTTTTTKPCYCLMPAAPSCPPRPPATSAVEELLPATACYCLMPAAPPALLAPLLSQLWKSYDDFMSKSHDWCEEFILVDDEVRGGRV